MKKCPVCDSSMSNSFSARMLKKYDVSYFFCDACGLLQTEEPYWLKEAYSDAIANSDTGLVARNISLSQRVSTLLYSMNGSHGKYVDCSGGTGLFVRLMRDIGLDFYWQDPYCENIHAKGFEYTNNKVACDAITAFEVLEHIIDPIEFIQNSLSWTNSQTLIFSTELFENQIPDQRWSYYSFNTGQHISFYQKKTLEIIARKLDLNFYSENGIHIMTNKKISKILLKLITGKLSFFAMRYVKKNLDSLTLKDSERLQTQ